MTTYSLIVKNIIKIENNFFNFNYKDDGINGIFKILFDSNLCKEITIKEKYKFFIDTLNDFYIKGTKKEEEFINYFCKIQKTYNLLNRLVYNYKYKKAKIVVNTDMGLNELTPNAKNVICILNNGSKYLFHINDIIKIINTSLTNSHMFFSEPLSIKNPYNNLPFDKSTLYNIYFFIRFNTNYYPELLFKFFDIDFNLTIFKNKNEYLLRENAINNFVYKSTSKILVDEINDMISDYNFLYKRNKILIDDDFPKDKLIKIFQPYLLLYATAQYAFLKHKKTEAIFFFKLSLKSFQTFNPQFGRKKYRLIIGYKKNFEKFIKEKIIEFDDRHIKFNDVEYQNKIFLKDHLKYEESNYDNGDDDDDEESNYDNGDDDDADFNDDFNDNNENDNNENDNNENDNNENNELEEDSIS